MKRKNLSPGALTAPLPPCMVTVGDMENNNVLTVGWTGILATLPPKTYISVRPSRHSHSFLGVGREFVINLPPASLAREVDFAGIYTGKKMDKFERCGLTRVKSEKVSPPTIAQCPISLECRVTSVENMGSHDVFFADIVSVSADESIMDKNGKIDFGRAGLLAYAHGEYFALGEKVGRFGFSTDKIKNKNRGAVTASAEACPSSPFRGASPGGKGCSSNSALSTLHSALTEKSEPFYKNAPRGKTKKKSSVSDKGKPHGKRVKKGER